MIKDRMDQNPDDWEQIRERIKRLADDTTFKNLADEIKRMLKASEPLSVEEEVAEVIRRCKANPVFCKELKAQLRDL